MENLREAIRENRYNKHTSGYFTDYAQANIVIIPRDAADDFSLFCRLNKKPCPVIHQSKPGEFYLKALGDIDIRTDVPAYRIYENGALTEEVDDIISRWRDDLVCFCIGCSFTFEHALTLSGIGLKHVEQKKNVAMYNTDIPLVASKLFKGGMVVSMRWIGSKDVDKAVEITAGFPDFHGAPVHIGDPGKIGIDDLSRPDYGEYTEPDEFNVPVFWACGVTPQVCLANAKLPFAITHKPGSMLITELTHGEILNNT